MLNASSHHGIVRARVCRRNGVADDIGVIKGDIDVCSCPSNCGRVEGDVWDKNGKRREDICEEERGGGEVTGKVRSASDNISMCSHILTQNSCKVIEVPHLLFMQLSLENFLL